MTSSAKRKPFSAVPDAQRLSGCKVTLVPSEKYRGHSNSSVSRSLEYSLSYVAALIGAIDALQLTTNFKVLFLRQTSAVAEQVATLNAIRKFIFSFVFRAATRLRFDLKEK